MTAVAAAAPAASATAAIAAATPAAAPQRRATAVGASPARASPLDPAGTRQTTRGQRGLHRQVASASAAAAAAHDEAFPRSRQTSLGGRGNGKVGRLTVPCIQPQTNPRCTRGDAPAHTACFCPSPSAPVSSPWFRVCHACCSRPFTACQRWRAAGQNRAKMVLAMNGTAKPATVWGAKCGGVRDEDGSVKGRPEDCKSGPFAACKAYRKAPRASSWLPPRSAAARRPWLPWPARRFSRRRGGGRQRPVRPRQTQTCGPDRSRGAQGGLRLPLSTARHKAAVAPAPTSPLAHLDAAVRPGVHVGGDVHR